MPFLFNTALTVAMLKIKWPQCVRILHMAILLTACIGLSLLLLLPDGSEIYLSRSSLYNRMCDYELLASGTPLTQMLIFVEWYMITY